MNATSKLKLVYRSRVKQLFVMVVYLNDRSARLLTVESEEPQQRFLEGVTPIRSSIFRSVSVNSC
jgi:hypothetical protein